MEGKKEIRIEDKKSSLTLENRRKLSITGVLEVISFNDYQILLNTSLGSMNIKGEGLRMNKLDVQNGDVIIIGKINSCAYSNSENKKDNESIFSKLFK
ncbi:sporulation protein YabP [Clostridium sp. USBA 49]|jgi:sporulation protein YabP|uniref:sporulation protein YabP n=1 Tax=Clostridium sp. USBA 49 TaxID=1881060 RepID=UPI00099A7817|nr:sporulation protein YabP [Clostridium sp. USBA 49]SKA78726.1 sporulation protein YabP [Clostridium sp. USBA 49]